MRGNLWIGCLMLAACVMLGAGCSSTTSNSASNEAKDKDKDKKDKDKKEEHAEAGPHKGAIVEWGEEEFHVEYTSDKDGNVTVYILGKDVKTATPIKADKIQLSNKDPKFDLELKAAPEKSDPMGKSSTFKGKLPDAAKGKKLSGTISGEVDGKPYAGDLKEK